jgi:hypothetical protein
MQGKALQYMVAVVNSYFKRTRYRYAQTRAVWGKEPPVSKPFPSNYRLNSSGCTNKKSGLFRSSLEQIRFSTQGRSRTGMSLRTQVFETSASTNSATWAFSYKRTTKVAKPRELTSRPKQNFHFRNRLKKYGFAIGLIY